MITLKELLASRSVRELNALARAHALPFSNQKPRSDVVARLYEDFSSQGCFQRALKRLRSEERTAIDVFVRYGGCLKSVDFFQRFGDIRPYHPWRTKTMPWKHPISIAESLWVKGFIQPRRGGVHLCADLIPFLTTTSPKPLSQAYSPFGTPDAERRRVGGEGKVEGEGVPLLHDLVIWLGMLMGASPRVRHDRWLPLAWLRAVDGRLLARDPRLAKARSELQMSRLSFLHYLAEVSGTVTTVQGRLMITQAAWDWLDLTPVDQLAALRRAVGADLSAREPLWGRYRLPAKGTHPRRQLLAQRLGQVGHLREIARAALVDPAEELRRAETLFAQLFAERGQPLQIELEQVDGRHGIGRVVGLSVRRR